MKSNLVDVVNRSVFPAKLHIEDGRIQKIMEVQEELDTFILPGFVDAHVHIESSMLTPVEFSRAAVSHGTIASVSDPHEIANVLGMKGVEFMIENAKQTPFKILFGAPSCVPATEFETSGARISATDIKQLLSLEDVGYLSEMMNYPGVIYGDERVLNKIEAAKEKESPVDGHAPGLRGEELAKYVNSGISTDHECFSIEEAKEKIQLGMNIQIREGSGAKNFNALIPLMNDFPEKLMFCSDDLHPDDLIKGHINRMVKRALELDYNIFDVLRAAGYNAIKHYRMDVGLLQEGDWADFILVNNLKDLDVQKVYIDGELCYGSGEVKIKSTQSNVLNRFKADKIIEDDLAIRPASEKIKIIQAIDGELITKKEIVEFRNDGNNIISDVERDHLKLVVINRYEKCSPAIGFIKGFGIKVGALASSIAHDSHNIICVGARDADICAALNWIIKNRGGVVAYDGNSFQGLPLPIAGIMTGSNAERVADQYTRASKLARTMGSQLHAPFMTLAFMSLLVIPELKLSDKGLFDGSSFVFTSLFDDN